MNKYILYVKFFSFFIEHLHAHVHVRSRNNHHKQRCGDHARKVDVETACCYYTAGI